ncbi:hypothetical protein L873DRAFT_1811997 [Choiromyces venosus 120613-1]|uniref:Transposase IS30-like HTH domain-containing protein n=1 Tax=Choiromyces venosus 120613-1 TaxID=1336337 RepID=A0A3N4JCE6_9PEZI|nr:hypothetical protein L873DRAFT_1811997 [Choiromyces venosus 120613-1]
MQQHKNSKRRELTEEERVSVILLYKEGTTYHKIGEEIGTSRTTVGRIASGQATPLARSEFNRERMGVFQKEVSESCMEEKRNPS